jgi:hypothetical protein
MRLEVILIGIFVGFPFASLELEGLGMECDGHAEYKIRASRISRNGTVTCFFFLQLLRIQIVSDADTHDHS